MPGKLVKFDCLYFDGAEPCSFGRVCNGCHSYRAIDKRILVIKLASTGDVLRTTAILPAIKDKNPNSHLTWVVNDSASGILDGNRYIERVLIYNTGSLTLLMVEEFDLVISLDKAKEAVSLAALVKAKKKYGFGVDKNGKIYPFNKESEYSFMLGVDDNLKFRENRKTYQELIFEMAKLKYKNQLPQIALDRGSLNSAKQFFAKHKLNKTDNIIGINTGAGSVFANKFLKPDRVIKLIKLLNKNISGKILLLGGPAEEGLHRYFSRRLGNIIIDGGCRNSLKTFSALVSRCSVVITADTLALHIATTVNVPVVALFGPTCPQEIDLYNRGIKIVTYAKCAPCYKNKCEKAYTCMDKISLDRIAESSQRFLNGKGS